MKTHRTTRAVQKHNLATHASIFHVPWLASSWAAHVNTHAHGNSRTRVSACEPGKPEHRRRIPSEAGMLAVGWYRSCYHGGRLGDGMKAPSVLFLTQLHANLQRPPKSVFLSKAESQEGPVPWGPTSPWQRHRQQPPRIRGGAQAWRWEGFPQWGGRQPAQRPPPPPAPRVRSQRLPLATAAGQTSPSLACHLPTRRSGSQA